MAAHRRKTKKKSKARKPRSTKKRRPAKKTKKRRANRGASRQMKLIHRLAKSAGLSYSQYMRREKERARAHRAHLATMSPNEALRHAIKTGALFGAEDIAEEIGMTREEVRAADRAAMQRDRLATEKLAASGDKQAQAVLGRINAMGG